MTTLNLDEPAGRGTATLRHDEPFEESGGSTKGGEGYGVLVDCYVVERRHEVEQGENAPFAQRVEYFVNAGGGKPAKGADSIELLVVHRCSDSAVFLGDGDHGADAWRS